MNTLTLNSYAKLNLYLKILNIRNDKYHNLKTLLERIDLHDRITLSLRQDKNIKISCSSNDVPSDTTNLVYRSAKLLQDALNVNKGVNIKIIKRIPVGAGLGGGSSNAATTLIGLNRLWHLDLIQDKLIDFAKTIGSDVPFFIYNTSFALGEARGDKIKPLKSLNKARFWHILVVPKIKVSTPFIYKKWDEYLKREKLTKLKYDIKILMLGLRKNDFSLIGKVLFNSLEIITTKLYPEVRRIKEKLSQLGLKAILMSGSGPAAFGIVSSRKEVASLSRQLKKAHQFWQVFITKTV